jgi:deazaflavin-dependent oxidoreductase (nitroreductase family)
MRLEALGQPIGLIHGITSSRSGIGLQPADPGHGANVTEAVTSVPSAVSTKENATTEIAKEHNLTGPSAHAPAAPAWVTVFNPVSRFLLRAGVPLGLNGLITIPGRRSGLPRSTAVAIIGVSGRRWVWAPWGGSNWVRNLRAAGRATITVRGRQEEVRAVELDSAERVAWFRDTLGPLARGMRFGVAFVRVVDRVDLSDPVAAAEGRALFELRPLA